MKTSNRRNPRSWCPFRWTVPSLGDPKRSLTAITFFILLRPSLRSIGLFSLQDDFSSSAIFSTIYRYNSSIFADHEFLASPIPFASDDTSVGSARALPGIFWRSNSCRNRRLAPPKPEPRILSNSEWNRKVRQLLCRPPNKMHAFRALTRYWLRVEFRGGG